MVRRVAVLVLSLACVATASAGPSSGGLKAALDQFVKAHPTYPGAQLAVTSPSLNTVTASGVDARSSRKPLDAAAGFRVASVTKTFTAASVLRLVEEGRLTLDDPIAKHLKPATAALLKSGGYDVPAIHVRHLLQHTSGLYDYAEDAEFQQFVLSHGQHHWTRAEQLRFAITHGQPYAKPGSGFHYSDTGYILLGEILEQVTGKNMGAAFRSLLGYARLGLDDTYLETFEPKPAKAHLRTHQYYDTIDSTGFDPSFDLYGGGGLVSSVDDLARFYRALLGGRVFHKAATLRSMLGKANPRTVEDLGMGIFSNEVGGEVCWGHSGFWGTTVEHCPRSGVTMALNVTQANGFDRPSQALLGKVLKLVRS